MTLKLSLLFAATLIAIPASAINIVTQSTNALASYPLGYYAPYGTQNNPGIGAVSWTQTSTFQTVTLQANVWAVNGYSTSPAVNYYLVNQIGAGTSLSNAITQGTVNIPISPQLVTLGTVAKLGPGTYYLVIDSSAPNSSWSYQFPGSATLTKDPSVTFNGDFGSRGGSVNTSYTPASGFSGFNVPFDFSVTAASATSSPEPASLFMAAAGLSLVLWRKRRAFFSPRSS